jgi:diguanylate cyclase (GGDEF)-like protein
MGGRGSDPDDGAVLTPSWPASGRVPRLTSPQVQRRVQAAHRRALRRAVVAGGLIIGGAVAVDAVHSAVALGEAGRQMAAYQLVELLGVGFVVSMAARGARIAEVLAFGMLLFSYSMSLLRLGMLPDAAALSLGYAVITLVGSGLFLPWSSRWHGTWLTAAVVVSVIAAGFLPGLTAPIGGAVPLVASIGLAAIVSFWGHRMWQVRLGAMLEQQFVLRELSRYARRQESHVTELNRELNRVVRRDPVTDVGNRLALDEAIARVLDPGERLRPMRFAVVLLDLDHFKAYNDEHGHLAGDAALARMGAILRGAIRGDDLAFRFGGEEFVLLLPDTDLDGALRLAERVRQAVALDHDSGLPPFTVSGGVAVSEPADGRDPGQILRRADAALYRAKRDGRNRVAVDGVSVAAQREPVASLA